MKTEIKMIVISFVLIFLYIGIFTYCVNAMQKDFHVLQVGIYSKEENKNQKINELKDKGMVAEYYKQDGKFYIISFLSDNLDDVEKYQKEYKVKGIIKTYNGFVNEKTSDFLKRLKEGKV